MKNGILTRFIIAKILEKLKKSNITFNECLDRYIKTYNLSNSDRKMIHTVVLHTMRNIYTTEQILNKFISKIKKNDYSYYLIISAITQILFLNFKSYAVINSTCDAYKKIKKGKEVHFINAVLRNIDRNKPQIKNLKFNKPKYPNWFRYNINKFNSKERKSLYKSITNKPTIHLQLKTSKDLNIIKEKSIKVSETSITLLEDTIIKDIPGYQEGRWWIQDHAATIPVKLMGNIKNKKVLDMCAAPGGKTMQLLTLGAKVTAYDISKKRIDKMIKNLNRLNLNCELINNDILKVNNKNKYDIVLLDAPCSAIGTIKRNPEILYRDKNPNLNLLKDIQLQLLNKASELLYKNGILIYSVCSFFESEGSKQIDKFLKMNNKFINKKIKLNEVGKFKKLITENGFFQSLPHNLKEIGGIDGFFIARLKKEK